MAQGLPGVSIFESSKGPVPAEEATFDRCYYLGTGAFGPIDTAVPIADLDEFRTFFGSSSWITIATLAMFFKNIETGFYYFRVGISPVSFVSVSAVAPGVYGVYFVTPDTQAEFTYTATSTDTLATIITALVNGVSNNVAINTEVVAEFEHHSDGTQDLTTGFWVRSLSPTQNFTVTVTPNLSATPVAPPATAQHWDYIRTLSLIQETMHYQPQGFLVAPEAFYSLRKQFQRTAVGQAMEQLCANSYFCWQAMLDCGPPDVVNHPRLAPVDALGYTSTKGHSACYYPWSTDGDGDDVSSAVVAAVVGLWRYRNEGWWKPPCGTQYVPAGVNGTRFNLGISHRQILKDARINPIVWKPGKGYVVYDCLTRSTDPNYWSIHHRTIFNIIDRSVFLTLDDSNFVFDSIDPLFIQRLQLTLEGYLFGIYSLGALFGATANDAFLVQIPQAAATLEAGQILPKIYASPSPIAREILVNVYRVMIGDIAVTAAGQTGAVSSSNQKTPTTSTSTGSTSGSTGGNH